MSTGRKNILYKDKKYHINDLVSYRKNIDLKHIFEDGEFIFIPTGEIVEISKIEDFNFKLKQDAVEAIREATNYSDATKVKNKIIDESYKKQKIDELESKLNDDDNIISIEELKELIELKYGKTYNVYINYENYIKINHKIPDLSDAELGKFYKILSKLTHKANTLLTKKDVRSNPITKNEISKLLNIDTKPTERYLKRLKDKGIIKQVTIVDKKHYMINPIYAFNGNSIGSYTYIYFKDEIDEVSDIPKELKLLWEYEFINSTIEG